MIWLLFAHFIFDAGLQPEWLLRTKKTNWFLMFEHAMVWTGGISLVLDALGMLAWWKILFLLVGHFLIDEWKAQNAKDILDIRYLYVDQGLHIAQLLFVYLL